MIRRVAAAAAALIILLSACAAAQEDKTFESLLGAAGETFNRQHAGAFLEIPGAGILLPVMQHPEDDGYYLEHNAFGEESEGGALYTQATYTSFDFSDPVTVIYGRRMDDETMFGSLQRLYSDSFDEVKDIVLYLPGEIREYTAVAAVPFSNIHLLYYYNFRLSRIYEAFFDEVYAVRRPGAQLDRTERPESGDDVLILSTGLKGDATQRYLVIAKINRTEIN